MAFRRYVGLVELPATVEVPVSGGTIFLRSAFVSTNRESLGFLGSFAPRAPGFTAA